MHALVSGDDPPLLPPPRAHARMSTCDLSSYKSQGVSLCNVPVCPNRSTIVQHLLNDSMDPFNRQPLTEDMFQPQAELRQRIEDFLAQRGGKPT